jgi:glycosyltransferase involved in cell wall biosynthesis
MTRAKILYLIPALVQGGAERQILELMRGIDPQRYDTSLCVFSNAGLHYDALLPEGEPRHVLHARSTDPAALWRFVELLRQERPQIVHSFMDRANFFARVGARLCGEPRPAVITSVRGPLMQLRYLVLERALSRLGARIVTNSAGIERELVHIARVPRERIQIIRNVVNLSRFGPASAEERAAARRWYGLGERDVAAAFVGWIGLAKYHVGLVHALGRMRRAGNLPRDLVILCAGRTRDRLPAEILPRLIALEGVGGHMRFLGAVKDVRSVYAAADFAVLPSLYEGLSNALLESMASGLPLVVSEGANRDGFVTDGVTGFVFRNARTRNLAAALERMLSLSPGERARMGEHGRERILRDLQPDRVLRETMALYDGVLGRAPDAAGATRES